MNERTFRATHAHKPDDPRRKEWLPPADVLDALPPLVGKTVADIGAGTGYFTLPMAQLPGGPDVIYAVDIQPEMLTLLQNRLPPESADKVRLVEGSATHTTLPDAFSARCSGMVSVVASPDRRAAALCTESCDSHWVETLCPRFRAQLQTNRGIFAYLTNRPPESEEFWCRDKKPGVLEEVLR